MNEYLMELVDELESLDNGGLYTLGVGELKSLTNSYSKLEADLNYIKNNIGPPMFTYGEDVVIDMVTGKRLILSGYPEIMETGDKDKPYDWFYPVGGPLPRYYPESDLELSE